MTIKILTLFPEMVATPLNQSIVGRAVKNGVFRLETHDLRQWATDNYRSVDDRPYGGGAGMVMRVDIIDQAVKALKSSGIVSKVVVLDAGGKLFNQQLAKSYSELDELILICGHYEGIDHRVHEFIADEVVSIGEYVLSGGEIAAMAVTDAVARLIPGVLGNEESLSEESYSELAAEYPQYTRPESYNGWSVPEVLTNGDHKAINTWRSTNTKLAK